jgi:fatty acid desaturase
MVAQERKLRPNCTSAVCRSNLKYLFARSTGRAIATVAGQYALIALTIFVVEASANWGLFYPLAILIIGTRQYALGESMAHEASHSHLSGSRVINEGLGFATTWPFFYTLSGYRRFHNKEHHNVPLDSSNNSIYEDYEDWGLPPAENPLTADQAVWHLVIKPLSGIISFRHLIKTIEDWYWDSDLVENTLMLVLWAVALALVIHFGYVMELLAYWIVPWLTVMAVLNFWSEVGDHYRVTDAATRSDLNWFVNTFISHNIGYHALHHHYPKIPWFRLPEAHRALRDDITEQISTGYLTTLRQIIEAKPVRTGKGTSSVHGSLVVRESD